MYNLKKRCRLSLSLSLSLFYIYKFIFLFFILYIYVTNVKQFQTKWKIVQIIKHGCHFVTIEEIQRNEQIYNHAQINRNRTLHSCKTTI